MAEADDLGALLSSFGEGDGEGGGLVDRVGVAIVGAGYGGAAENLISADLVLESLNPRLRNGHLLGFYPSKLPGVLITLEGPEGAGKSTVARRLGEALAPHAPEIILTREPGEGDFGAKIRHLLLHEDHLTPWAELSLFLADRAEHCARMIGPAIARGAIVICDRFADSTIVYQGYGRGLELELLRRLNAEATGGIRPTVTLLLDLPAEVGLARVESPDRLDGEDIEFHRRVRQGFLSEAKHEPSRWRIIDATQSPEAVSEACLREILPLVAGAGL